MKYANDLKVPYVIIIGEEEKNSNLFTLKNMVTGEQQKQAIHQIIEIVKQS
jgi:histidyl-tRNA synthetase